MLLGTQDGGNLGACCRLRMFGKGFIGRVPDFGNNGNN